MLFNCVGHTCLASNLRITENVTLGRVWKEVVVTYFKVGILRYSRRWRFKCMSFGLRRCVLLWYDTIVSEVNAAYIFRVKRQYPTTKLHGVTTHRTLTWHLRGNMPAFSGTDWGKPRCTSIRIAGLWFGIEQVTSAVRSSELPSAVFNSRSTDTALPVVVWVTLGFNPHKK
jgi:hypothetical protein